MINSKGRSRKKNRVKQIAPAVYILIGVLASAAIIFMGIAMAAPQQRPAKDGVAPETDIHSSPGDTRAEAGDAWAEAGDTRAEAGDDGLDRQVSTVLSSMTLEEKIAQMFMVTPEALTGYSSVTQAGEATRAALNRRPVGGLVYFKNNLISPEQVVQMTSNTRRYAEELGKFPILLAVDEEGGEVTRIAGQAAFGETRFSDMSAIGAAGDTGKAYEAGQTIGAYLGKYGFNMDFAPDADVLTNPENQVVRRRSFGSDPKLVWDMSRQVAAGLSEQGIQPVYKHFPGHGATQGDTHEGFAYTDKNLEQLMETDLIPFIQAVEYGADCMMVAHIAAPQVTEDEMPASLSGKMITEILREKLGYEGVVVTDALNMGAIRSKYTSGEAAVQAVQAGADLLLMPVDFEEAYQALLAAVREGRITESRINESVMRIGRMKLK